MPFVSVPHTSPNRLLLSNQDKGCTPSVAHSLALPLGPALLKPKPLYYVTFHVQSHFQGPECKAIEKGEYNGTRLLFAGVEGISTIMVFSFSKDNQAEPKFESIYRHAYEDADKTFKQLADDFNMGDLNPEYLK